MTKKQYAKMDWAGIEAIVYSDSEHPFEVLGARKSGKETLIQTFYPTAKEVSLILKEDEKKVVPMEMVDEEGFFAAFLSGTAKKAYCFEITEEDGTKRIVEDAYRFEPVSSAKIFKNFVKGEETGAYDILGAHVSEQDGVAGVNFVVWAPNALRASVVGDWNSWDGRVHPMEKMDEYGIFALFIPGVKAGDAYRFELKIKGNELLLKNDPYARQLNQDGISIVAVDSEFNWTDADFKRNADKLSEKPVHVCHMSLDALVKEAQSEKTEFLVAAKTAVSKLTKLGYTHVNLMPVSEASTQNKTAYHTAFYYAVKRDCADVLKLFVNECHAKGLSVLLDWSIAYFAKDSNGLEWFDGTCLYEHADKRKGYQPVFDANVFQYQRTEVRNFLVSNAFYFMKEYHFDGIRMNDLASVLYLDYGRNEWVGNIYGGKENLEAVSFIKELNGLLKKEFPGCLLVGDIDAVWENASNKHENSLGFDYVWNNGFKKEIISYLKTDPMWREGKLLSILSQIDYAYHENFMLPISAELFDDTGMLADISGILENKYAALRMLLVYTMLYPGKKISYVDMNGILEPDKRKKHKRCDLAYKYDNLLERINKLYSTEKLLYGYDNEPNGFCWINHEADISDVATFVRKGGKKNELLYVIANFSDKEYDALELTVPYAGKYMEIISTDASEFGGTGNNNIAVIPTGEKPYDETISTLTVKMAPMSISVFTYKPFTAKELAEIAEHKRQMRIAYVKSERAKIEKARDEIIAQAIKDAELRIKELEKILEEK